MNAQFLTNELHDFMENQPTTVSTINETWWAASAFAESAAEKRARLRSKGIWIEADNPERNYTEMEKTNCISRPFIANEPPRELEWKHKRRRRRKKKATKKKEEAKEEDYGVVKFLMNMILQSGESSEEESSVEEVKVEARPPLSKENALRTDEIKLSKEDHDRPTAEVSNVIPSGANNDVTKRKGDDPGVPPLPSNSKERVKVDTVRLPPRHVMDTKKEVEKVKSRERTGPAEQKKFSVGADCINKSKDGVKAGNDPRKLPQRTLQNNKSSSSVGSKKTDPCSSRSAKSCESASCHSVLMSGRSQVRRSVPSAYIKEWKQMKKEVFGDIDACADLKEVVIAMKSQKPATDLVYPKPDDGIIIESARKIVEVTCQHDVIEKSLSKEENERMANFFSGRAPLSQQVLEELDGLLDSMFVFATNHLNKYEDIFMQKKKKIKLEVLRILLTEPENLPKSWIREHEAQQEKEAREREDINWEKVLFYYPRERTFNDGPADKSNGESRL
ncbi:hypothetical protein Y032_0057g2809 [Ancylostoma ceylanicum]|uniref:Uncharacterized protein n=3 Tax=Ancylostoma ceylanicum TaxID=53326 RepID=A0A016U4V6_9BILA|nr:hypothetical protein Y032_0057g2809 [Ancylostoma ceylanicum]